MIEYTQKVGVLIRCLLCFTLVLPVDVRGQTRPVSTSASDVASLEGNVVDADTRQPIPGATVTARTESGNVSGEQIVPADGAFHFSLDPKQTYVLVTKASGYQPTEERLAFTSSYTNRLYGKLIRLKRADASTPASQPTASRQENAPRPTAPTQPAGIPPATNASAVAVRNTPPPLVAKTGETTQLRAIQFVQSKPDLLPEAQPALDQLLAFMQTNPSVEIELSGHTDNQGDFDKNMALSKERVDVVKKFLVKNGIKARRISTKGYGPTRPIASNSSEETRRLNRRVEMTVLKQ
ncbi:Outer membrane porin F AltName: Full=Root adhesin [Fibrisoma limi BUZ 3]|uniref:OprF7 protein n=1 Tax=Fibrisoma limi BUZ 3 TaxID=1185876 RepID=I2GKY3_9BACT|nr:OmpA family protein [Fibrisoma limi]CCH54559.1 Outer membrane porin F AltName: Full=Root adhesin [Fibrisoma limi BUZ 3]